MGAYCWARKPACFETLFVTGVIGVLALEVTRSRSQFRLSLALMRSISSPSQSSKGPWNYLVSHFHANQPGT